MASRLKVLHVVESFGGGVFTSVVQILNSLDPSEYDVGLVYSVRPETPRDVAAHLVPSVRVWQLDMGREIAPWRDVRAVRCLAGIFRRERPDVVHLHSSKAGAVGRVAARLATVPRVFYSPRGFAFLRQDVPRIVRAAYWAFERFGAMFGGTIVACSEGELAAARALGAPVVLVRNAVDVAAVDRVAGGPRPEPIREGGAVNVGIVGRLAAQRGPRLFGAVAAAVAQRFGRRVRFLWVGGGPDTSLLAGAPVEVSGWLSREEALARLATDVDIYLHTSLWEGLPLAVLEAMALRKPVVATDVVGNRDAVVPGRTGFLGRDVHELVKGVSRLVEDPVLRERMGMEGRRRVLEEFSLPAMMAALSRLYRDDGGRDGAR